MPHAYSPSDAGLKYVPSLDTYLSWQQKQQQQQQLGSTKPNRKTIALPAGFPDLCQSEMVWEGSDVQESGWVVLLSESYLQEIDNALHFFQIHRTLTLGPSSESRVRVSTSAVLRISSLSYLYLSNLSTT